MKKSNNSYNVLYNVLSTALKLYVQPVQCPLKSPKTLRMEQNENDKFKHKKCTMNNYN